MFILQTRYPSAIGFYPGDRNRLITTIEDCIRKGLKTDEIPQFKPDASYPRRIKGGISPHAGYVFSGPTAAKLMTEIVRDGKPDTFILLGLLHAGTPLQVVMSEGIWKTQLGDALIDQELAVAILKSSSVLVDDSRHHKNEHSIEVQLPFLQYFFPRLKIVPIALGVSDFDDIVDISHAIVEGVKSTGRDVVVIASTDMTHYGYSYGYAPLGQATPPKILEFMRDTDQTSINFIEAFDGKGLVENVRQKGITMCGVAPVATTLLATGELGATQVNSLEYTTSFEAYGGSIDQVVGYYSATIT